MSNVKIETYEITELTSAGELENPDESKKLIAELGLEGQNRFVNPESDKPIFPYRKMTQHEYNVFKTLCPKKIEATKYSDGVIPLRVLQILAHAKSTEFLDELEIWHPQSADIVDLVLVGKKNIKNNWGSHDTEYYILARWGSVLESIERLTEIAKPILLAKLKSKYEECKAKLTADATSLESAVDRFLAGEGSSEPSVSYCGVR